MVRGHRDPSWEKKGYYKEKFSCPHCGGLVSQVSVGARTDHSMHSMNFYCPSCNLDIKPNEVHWKKVPSDDG